jgi:hypothetical protein
MSLTSEGIGNVLRLKGLKTATGRRVMPGSEYEMSQSPTDMDLSGTGTSNLPMPSTSVTGGIAPESYDVRANSVLPKMPLLPQTPGTGYFPNTMTSGVVPKQEDTQAQLTPPRNNSETMSKMGKYLGASFPSAQAPQEALPQPSEIPQDAANAKANAMDKMGKYLGASFPSAQAPQEALPQPSEIPQGKPSFIGSLLKKSDVPTTIPGGFDDAFTSEIAEATKEPFSAPVFGATEYLSSDPKYISEFNKITGADASDPNIQEGIKIAETAMSSDMKSLEELESINKEQILSLKDRIKSNSTNDMDKYYIGLALAVPLAIAAFMGKEAGIGALAGGLGGISDMIGNREKGVKEDEKTLSNLVGAQTDLLKDRMSIKEKYAKEKEGILSSGAVQNEGMGRKTLKDPNTGDAVIDTATGEPVSGIALSDLLVAPDYRMTDKDAVNDMRTKAAKLGEIGNFSESITDATEEAVELLKKAKDLPQFEKAFRSYISGKAPGILSSVSDKIIHRGRETTIGTALDSVFAFIKNELARVEKMGQLDKPAQEVMKEIITNPERSFASPDVAVDQLLRLRHNVQKSFSRQAGLAGFYPQFIDNEFRIPNERVVEMTRHRKDAEKWQKLKAAK